MKKTIVCIAAFTLALAVSAAHADPQTEVGFRGWGPRVGMTINPDQIHFGGHVDFGNFAEHIRLQPSLAVGLGDDLTVIALNLDGQYRFASTWDVWTPYAGGGPGIFTSNFDTEGVGGWSDPEFGFSAVGGIEKGMANGSRFFVEGRLGLIDAPDFKVLAGWTFFH